MGKCTVKEMTLSQQTSLCGFVNKILKEKYFLIQHEMCFITISQEDHEVMKKIPISEENKNREISLLKTFKKNYDATSLLDLNPMERFLECIISW